MPRRHLRRPRTQRKLRRASLPRATLFSATRVAGARGERGRQRTDGGGRRKCPLPKNKVCCRSRIGSRRFSSLRRSACAAGGGTTGACLTDAACVRQFVPRLGSARSVGSHVRHLWVAAVSGAVGRGSGRARRCLLGRSGHPRRRRRRRVCPTCARGEQLRRDCRHLRHAARAVDELRRARVRQQPRALRRWHCGGATRRRRVSAAPK